MTFEPPAPPLSSSAEPLDVVIAFDDAAAYRRALQLLVRTVGPVHGEFELRPRPWHFERLSSPEWHRYACDDAAMAGVVIVATTRTAALPENVRAWIRASCTPQRRCPAIVVALLGTDDADTPERRSSYEFLRSAANGAGMAFLAPGDPKQALAQTASPSLSNDVN